MIAVRAEVLLVQKRIPYQVNRGTGYSNPDHRWRWGCPVCPFSCEDRDRDTCQQEADAHDCGSGWSPIPIAGPFAELVERVTPTAEDRERWEAQRKARRGVKR
jgi:hypothetical protein